MVHIRETISITSLTNHDLSYENEYELYKIAQKFI